MSTTKRCSDLALFVTILGVGDLSLTLNSTSVSKKV